MKRLNSLPLNRVFFLAALFIVIILGSGYFLLFTGVLKLTLPILLIIAIISVALVTVATSAFAIFVKNPIKQMTDAVERLAQGDLGATLQLGSDNEDNEIGKLAECLRLAFVMLQNIVNEVSSTLIGMSQADFSMEDLGEYEGDFAQIPKAINSILDIINTVFNTLDTYADQVNRGSVQVSNAAQELAQGSTEQASSIEELFCIYFGCFRKGKRELLSYN